MTKLSRSLAILTCLISAFGANADAAAPAAAPAAPAPAAKPLVVYFSATGSTKAKAETLAKAIGADLREIVPAKRYTAADLDYMNSSSRSSVEMKDPASRPAIEGKVENIAAYDPIYVGFPIWWGKVPHVVNTFLEAHDLVGKHLVPFFTSGGSGAGKTAEQLRASAPKAVVAASRRVSGMDEAALRAWAASAK